MTSKPVVPTRQAQQDLETGIDYYLFEEGSEAAALGFITAVEDAFQRLGKNPAMGSPRYAYELDLPGLRSWPLKRDPHLVFYVERDDYVEIWRVIHGVRDIPAWLLNENG
ncbi:type II toxin-antitoxin system RelE/ParE family toxin [Paraburkholderia terrae]|uniref:type II toxin-antitoxin system RelE/ParE family toxin n=1 Tax=Paraburkholderia terrae TaxID=311230 RepID=UPI0020680E2E|nr:type II toxin-antitoxin system RelE/ParE family toxin [Paraburkholderia terrae]BDC45523.1 plasmid stabilization protein [Paraburkholderia terrae]